MSERYQCSLKWCGVIIFIIWFWTKRGRPRHPPVYLLFFYNESNFPKIFPVRNDGKLFWLSKSRHKFMLQINPISLRNPITLWHLVFQNTAIGNDGFGRGDIVFVTSYQNFFHA